MSKLDIPSVKATETINRISETQPTIPEAKPTSDRVTPLSSPSFFRIIRAIVASIDRRKQLELENAARLASKD